MKRILITIVAGLGLAVPAAATDCPLPQAVYEQPGGQVTLRFAEVPRDGAANQIAAFAIEMDGVAATLDGAIYIPNGFGQPYGMVGLDCTGAEDEECGFWEGIVYALGDDGIGEFPWDPDLARGQQLAPRQVLLPAFASDVWYSMLRQSAFEGERDVLDTFTLATCAS
jgi:hypothetical protein